MSSSDKEIKDKELFDKISWSYAKKDIYPISKKARQSQIDCIMSFVAKNYKMNPKIRLLELGCGSGGNSLYLKKFYDQYLGIDYSENLIKIAKERYSKENIDFITSNIKDLSGLDRFDIVIGIGILHHVDNLDQVFKTLNNVGHRNTIFIFFEPQSGNPLIQFLRRIRMKVDSAFSEDQVFFKKNELVKNIRDMGFTEIRSRYNGYFVPPFAQIILKPLIIFYPLSRIAIILDRFLFTKVNTRFSWNFIITFKKGY